MIDDGRLLNLACRNFTTYIVARGQKRNEHTAMASNSTVVPLPNPNTPLAFLPPEIAYQTSVAIYVLAGGLGVSAYCLIYV